MQNSIESLCITDKYTATLSKNIQLAYNTLTQRIVQIPYELWTAKVIPSTHGLLSPQNLIAYQIGWGKLLLYWYSSGMQGISPTMPGQGFTSWNYQGLAQHFYSTYAYDTPFEQHTEFQQTVLNILAFCDKEYMAGNLDKIGVWAWCTLSSGKKWPLSKWIQVNTVAPYKRAMRLIQAYLNNR